MKIEDFISQYASAFSGRNLTDLVDFYRFPVAFYLEDGTSTTMDELEFYENGKKLISLYESLGMASVSFHIVSKIQINQSCILVEVEWSLMGSSGNSLVSFVTRYIVGVQDETVKILGVFMVNEREVIYAFTNTHEHNNGLQGSVLDHCRPEPSR